MEIPVINRIIDFETSVNPSLVSQLSAASGIGKFYQTYNLWKWGALIIALIASFTTIINKVKLLIIRLKNYRSQSQSKFHLLDDDDDYESDADSFSSDDDDDEEEDDDDGDEEGEESATTSFSTYQNWRQYDEDFRVRGSGHVYIDDEQWQNQNLGIRRRRRSIGDLFSWSELMTSGSKNVVKLWDNLGLGLGLNMEDDLEDEFTIYDMPNEQEIRKINSFIGRKDEFPAIVSTSSSSPGMIVSAATSNRGRVTLSGWDTRIGSRLPAILAEWRPKLGSIVGIKAGGVKFVIRDNVSNALTVGDLRKINSPLNDPTRSDVDTWWDADAVIAAED